MTSDKTQRDALNNERFQDILHPRLSGAMDRVLSGNRLQAPSGDPGDSHWTVLLNCAKGSSIPRHEHLGAGEYYVISGKIEVRGGVENGGITAITGDYGYEPNGVIHDMTNFPEDTSLYFTNFGPIRYIDDDNNTVGFLDWQGVLKASRTGRRGTGAAVIPVPRGCGCGWRSAGPTCAKARTGWRFNSKSGCSAPMASRSCRRSFGERAGPT